jgi:hypothetical protein
MILVPVSRRPGSSKYRLAFRDDYCRERGITEGFFEISSRIVSGRTSPGRNRLANDMPSGLGISRRSDTMTLKEFFEAAKAIVGPGGDLSAEPRMFQYTHNSVPWFEYAIAYCPPNGIFKHYTAATPEAALDVLRAEMTKASTSDMAISPAADKEQVQP